MSYSNYTETLEGRGILLKVQQASQQLPCLVGAGRAGIWAAAVPHGAVITCTMAHILSFVVFILENSKNSFDHPIFLNFPRD